MNQENNLEIHQTFIKKCFDLALKARGQVSPNPLVGALLVKNGEIIGEGYHKKAGLDHAEIDAVNDAQKNGHDLTGATLYCNLEPCCHTNKKTPPCAQYLTTLGLNKVVISNIDPNPEVARKGLKILKETGIEVVEGVLKEEGEKINRVFFYAIKNKMPYIHIKVAQTLDGIIATHSGDSKWISNEKARREVHQLRMDYDAVAVGKNTAITDNPTLNVRMGINSGGKVPYRIVYGNIHHHRNLNLLTDQYKDKTIVIEDGSKQREQHQKILKELYQRGIHSILVEGGQSLISTFIQHGFFNKITVYIAAKIHGNGRSFFQSEYLKIADAKKIKLDQLRQLDDQIVVDYLPDSK